MRTDIRTCEQCGTSFTPRREHARFCSPRCRVAWNRRQASEPPAETGALDWSITAMVETTDRLQQAGRWDRADGLTVISEAVWWVTMVDATLVRYHLDVYSEILARQPAAQRRMTEDTFGGLRFVRNQMGYAADPADFIQPLDLRPGTIAHRIAAWTWKAVPEPAAASPAHRAHGWELTRYRAYQRQLVGSSRRGNLRPGCRLPPSHRRKQQSQPRLAERGDAANGPCWPGSAFRHAVANVPPA
jgi:hypothetical protein